MVLVLASVCFVFSVFRWFLAVFQRPAVPQGRYIHRLMGIAHREVFFAYIYRVLSARHDLFSA